MIFEGFHRHTSKLAFILMCIIILLLVADISIARIYILIYGNIFSGSNLGISIDWNVLGFTLITAICLTGQFIMLKAVTIRTKEVSTKDSSASIKYKKLVSGIQYTIVALFISMIL